MYEYNSIAESNNFIVLDKYEKYASCVRETGTYQTEADLEHEFIQDLRNQLAFVRKSGRSYVLFYYSIQFFTHQPLPK